MGMQGNMVIPNGVTKYSKATETTSDNVGKVFDSLSKYLNSSKKSVSEFTHALNSATLKFDKLINYNSEKVLQKEVDKTNNLFGHLNDILSGKFIDNLNNMKDVFPYMKDIKMITNVKNDVALSDTKALLVNTDKTNKELQKITGNTKALKDSSGKKIDKFAELKDKIKKEAESKHMKYLDSEYAKGTNSRKKWNEYQDERAKLKTQAIDVYGKDYKNNPEYIQAMENLDKKYVDEIKQANKEDLKENHEFLGLISDKIVDTVKSNQDSLRGILGPLNLFVAPFEKFFGGTVFKMLGGAMKGIFGVFRKKRPSASDVVKAGAMGVGSLYLASILEKKEGGDGKGGGLLEGLFGGIGKGLSKLFGGGGLLKALPMAGGILGLAGSILWCVIDGIKGALKAEDWGVSKFSGFLGGFFGGAEGGIKNAFANAGKFALMGASIGTICCPVIGTIAGGLIGAAVGGLLGAIGGENLAKGFDGIGKWLKDVLWSSIVEIFEDMFNIQKFKEIFSGEGTFGEKIGKALPEIAKTIVLLPFKLLTSGPRLLAKIFTKTMKAKNFKEAVGKVGTTLMNSATKAVEGVKKGWEATKNFAKDVWKGVKESEFGEFVSNIFTKMHEGIQKFFKENPLGIWLNKYIIQPIKNGLGKIGNFFGYIASVWNPKKPIESISEILQANNIGLTYGKYEFSQIDMYGYLKQNSDWLKNQGWKLNDVMKIMTTDNRNKLSQTDTQIWYQVANKLVEWKDAEDVDDAIIKTDGQIIKTNPKDTIVALKDIPNSMNEYKNKVDSKSISTIASLQIDSTFERKLTDIVTLLSKISEKNLEVKLPQQTRKDIDLIINGDVA